MRRTGNLNENTPFYWDAIYEDANKLVEYEKLAHTAEHDGYAKDGTFIRPSSRMKTMAENAIGERVLDIGCGVGALTRMIKDRYPEKEVWGMDIASSAIRYCSERDKDIKYVKAGVGMLRDIPEVYFDTVLAGEVLEHLEDPNDLFKDAFKLLRRGGRFIVSCPNGDAIISNEHVWFVDKEDVAKLFTDNGFAKPTFIKLPRMEHMMVILAYGEKP